MLYWATIGLLLFVQFGLLGCGMWVHAPGTTTLQQTTQATQQQVVQVESSQSTLKSTLDSAKAHSEQAIQFLAQTLELLRQSRPPEQVIPVVESATDAQNKTNDDLKNAQQVNLKLGAQVTLLKEQMTESSKQIAELIQDHEKLSSSLSTVTKEKETAIEARDSAVDKYNQAWLGGKTWRLIGWVTGASIVLLIVGLILNMHTDIFVWPLKIIGWLFTPKS